METWVLFALLSAISGGLANFGVKIIVERGYNVYLFSLWGNVLASIYLSIILLFQGIYIDTLLNISPLIFILAFINISLLIFSVSTRSISLKNIDTVIFYPIYKTLGPIIITMVSIFVFSESLTLYQIIGIVLGLLVPMLLITSGEKKIQKNLFLGIFFILATVFLTSIASVVPKIVQIQELDVNSYLVSVFLIGSALSGGMIRYSNKKRKHIYPKGSILFWISSCSFHFWAMYFFTHALVGNLAIVFTINSFSILIPIILSIIFYGEHFNLKKGIVIALSIISILLFI